MRLFIVQLVNQAEYMTPRKQIKYTCKLYYYLIEIGAKFYANEFTNLYRGQSFAFALHIFKEAFHEF